MSFSIVRPEREGPVVLVVEDDPQAAELLRLYLEGTGCCVEIARNLHPALLTLDLLLPKMDGWDLLVRLYAAIGTVTNLASRLCDEAKGGQILISQRVYGAIEELIEAEPLDQRSLKGFSKPVVAYNVIDLKGGGERAGRPLAG